MRILRPRRFLEAMLILAIVVAYLLVVTRGQIVEIVAGSFSYPVISPAPVIASPSIGEPFS